MTGTDDRAKLEAVRVLHQKSWLPAASGEHRGKHYCVECTTFGDDYVYYRDWPCFTARLVGAPG